MELKTQTRAETVNWQFFVSEGSGDLHDCRNPNWVNEPLRKEWRKHFRQFENMAQVKATIRAGEFAWPGAYSLAFITKDGGAICFNCARKEFRLICDEFQRDSNCGFRVSGLICEAETDSGCACDHCCAEIWPEAEL